MPTSVVKANTVALTTDIWTSKAIQSFATTTAHFIDKNWNLTTCVLETTHFPGHYTGVSTLYGGILVLNIEIIIDPFKISNMLVIVKACKACWLNILILWAISSILL